MKRILTVLVGFVLGWLVLHLMLNTAIAQTNTDAELSMSNTPVMADPIIPQVTWVQNLQLLFKGYDGQIARLLAILGAIKVLLASFGGKIQRFLADGMNAVAARQNVDDDQYLRDLFSKPWYKAFAFLLMFVSIRIPTLPDLERTIGLQNEAVSKAIDESASDSTPISKPTSPGGLGLNQ